MSDVSRTELARYMVATLPAFGHWANSFRDFDTPYGKVGFRQLSVLWAIRYRLIPDDDVSPSRLAEFHDVQRSVITRALAKLESAGFVVRTSDSHDKRRAHIEITQRGRRLSEFVEDLYTREMLASMSFLNDNQIAELRRNVETLGKIVNDLEDRRATRNSNLARHGTPKGSSPDHTESQED